MELPVQKNCRLGFPTEPVDLRRRVILPNTKVTAGKQMQPIVSIGAWPLGTHSVTGAPWYYTRYVRVCGRAGPWTRDHAGQAQELSFHTTQHAKVWPCSNDNSLGVSLFEFRQAHQLCRLTFFEVFFSPLGNAATGYQLGHNHFLPNHFQFVISLSSHHSTPYNLRYWQHRKILWHVELLLGSGPQTTTEGIFCGVRADML
jgi:hypothetical protein